MRHDINIKKGEERRGKEKKREEVKRNSIFQLTQLLITTFKRSEEVVGGRSQIIIDCRDYLKRQKAQMPL